MENKNNVENNVLKFGVFQLQTKSFWLSLISIISLFILIMVGLNSYYWDKVNTKLIELNMLLINSQNNVQNQK